MCLSKTAQKPSYFEFVKFFSFIHMTYRATKNSCMPFMPYVNRKIFLLTGDKSESSKIQFKKTDFRLQQKFDRKRFPKRKFSNSQTISKHLPRAYGSNYCRNGCYWRSRNSNSIRYSQIPTGGRILAACKFIFSSFCRIKGCHYIFWKTEIQKIKSSFNCFY